MALEIVCVRIQAARGTTSHFSYGTWFDAAIFQIMGVAITCQHCRRGGDNPLAAS